MFVRRMVSLSACLIAIATLSIGCSSDETNKAKLLGIQVNPESARIAEGETSPAGWESRSRG